MGCCQSDQDQNLVHDSSYNPQVYSNQSIASSETETDRTSSVQPRPHKNSLPYDKILEYRKNEMSLNHQKYNFDYISSGNVLITPKTDFFSQYTMGEFLGQGGFGTVIIGVHKITNVKRAIKMVSKLTLSEKDKIILLQELSLLKSIDHPNILKILEHYEDDQHHFFVTELLNGGELFVKIQEEKGFSEKQASNYMKQILSAVSYCHSQNIVHRDLKPENILFTSKKSDQIKVIDFGCSTRFDQSKKIKDIAGTVQYLAPEVIKKSLYDEKCDIWSIGVVLYIMLCGYPPFQGQTDEELFDEIQNKQLEFEGSEWEKISYQARDLIDKMLQKDPSIRISAQEAYRHPWIQMVANNNAIQERLMKNLASFSAKNKIKTALLNMISLHILKNKEKKDIIQNFQELDKDGDGQLSKEELIEGYERLSGDRALAEKIVDFVFKEVDFDGSGKVSFQEFLVASANKEQILSRDNLLKAFDLIDEDRNGYITKEELERVIGGTSLNSEVWEQMMKECDINGDGRIDKNEFVDLILKWLEKDLFTAKQEYKTAEQKNTGKRKGSLILVQKNYNTPPRNSSTNPNPNTQAAVLVAAAKYNQYKYDPYSNSKLINYSDQKKLDNYTKPFALPQTDRPAAYSLYNNNNNYYNNNNLNNNNYYSQNSYLNQKSMVNSAIYSNSNSKKATNTNSLNEIKQVSHTTSGDFRSLHNRQPYDNYSIGSYVNTESIKSNYFNQDQNTYSKIGTYKPQQQQQPMNPLSQSAIQSPQLTTQSVINKNNIPQMTQGSIQTYQPSYSIVQSLKMSKVNNQS